MRTAPPETARTAADLLLADVAADPIGAVSASIYETARLVSIAPWLPGHAERVEYLLSSQGSGGLWGGPGMYALVPTLSATEALLTIARTPDARPATAAARGLQALRPWLGGAPLELPDTIAVELIVPALVTDINRHLDAVPALVTDINRHLGAVPPLVTDINRHLETPLTVPGGMDPTLPTQLRAWLRAGAPVPPKTLHSLEVAGTDAQDAAGVRPTAGTIGCSPAATAAWIGDAMAMHSDAGQYLDALARRGPVPSVSPITVFERAWVITTLADAGLELRVPASLRRTLKAGLGPSGAPAGPGLPPDADDTAMALTALAAIGVGRPPDCLWRFERDGYFCCFEGERTPSTSTNAHVIDAFARYVADRPPDAARYLCAIDAVAGWLCDRQRPDGSWLDKWHASPYYATFCCAVSVDRAGGRRAVDRAVDWILTTQRDDGSWGCWAGTVEETAYAVQTLLHTASARTEAAARRGCAWLRSRAGTEDYPPLWHDKDLYAPAAVIRAAAIAALHLGDQFA